MYTNYQNHNRIYVDCAKGNDFNVGSKSLPIKTLDKFFELANERSDIRCYIVSSGTYTVTRNTFCNMVVHIEALASNVTIKFNNASCISIYNSHFKLIGKEKYMNVYFPLEDGNHAENCAMSFYNVRFIHKYTQISSRLLCDGCRFDKGISLYATMTSLKDCVLGDTISIKNGSALVLEGTTKYIESAESCVNSTDSTLVVKNAPTVQKKSKYGIVASNSTIFANASKLSAFSGLNGNKMTCCQNIK